MNGPHISELPEPRGVRSCARGINPARGGDPWGGRRRFRGWGSRPRVRGGPLAGTRRREGQILGLGHGRARWAERQPGPCPGAPGPGLLSSQFTHLLGEPLGSSGSHGDEEAAPGGARAGQAGSTVGGGGQARPHHTGCLSRSSAPLGGRIRTRPEGPGYPAGGLLQLEAPLEGVTGTQTPRDGQGFICDNVTSTHTEAGDELMLLALATYKTPIKFKLDREKPTKRIQFRLII